MKNTMFGAIAALGLSTAAAYASDLAFVGETEYAFEAETFSLEGGAEYTVNAFTFSGVAMFEDTQTTDFDFTGVELEAGYDVIENVTAFVRLEADDELEYDETVVGASFSF